MAALAAAASTDLKSTFNALPRLTICHGQHTSSSSGASHSCHVRFDDACVVIPEASPSKKPILAIPSGARILNRISSRNHSHETDMSLIAPETEDKERGRPFQFRIPSIPGKRRSASRGETRSPTSPTSPSRVHRRTRSASMPISTCTVPLRECCKACIPIVEAYLASPSQPEKMTYGAQRIHSQGLPRVDKVMVDEVDAICDAPSTRLRLDLSKQRSLVQQCIPDEDEGDLFPLPSPSPRNSPRNSPNTSPSASTTNLTTSATTSESPPVRRASPLSNCFAQKHEEHTQPIMIPTSPVTLPACDTYSPGRASVPEQSRSPKKPGRRTSFSTIGGAVSRGGVAVLKGFSDLRLSP